MLIYWVSGVLRVVEARGLNRARRNQEVEYTVVLINPLKPIKNNLFIQPKTGNKPNKGQTGTQTRDTVVLGLHIVH